jgi:hypothetical protein
MSAELVTKMVIHCERDETKYLLTILHHRHSGWFLAGISWDCWSSLPGRDACQLLAGMTKEEKASSYLLKYFFDLDNLGSFLLALGRNLLLTIPPHHLSLSPLGRGET